jgi:hypothetical protein
MEFPIEQVIRIHFDSAHLPRVQRGNIDRSIDIFLKLFFSPDEFSPSHPFQPGNG